MTMLIIGALLVAAWLGKSHATNPYRYQDIYRCLEDGEDSALYIRMERHYSFAGGFTVEKYKRVTCAPGQVYVSAESDWFDPWCGHSKAMLFTFQRLSTEEAERLMAIQLPITRGVKRQIEEARAAGTLKPNQGFSMNL